MGKPVFQQPAKAWDLIGDFNTFTWMLVAKRRAGQPGCVLRRSQMSTVSCASQRAGA